MKIEHEIRILSSQYTPFGKDSPALRLSFPEGSAGVFVAYTPANQRELETRLKWVEKQAARFLISPPVLYGITRRAKNSGRSAKKELRLSVALSLSVGPPCPQRYSLVKRLGVRQPTILEEGNVPLGSVVEELKLRTLPDWAKPELPKLAQAALSACDTFRKKPEIETSLLALGESQRAELTYLERLYQRKKGANDRLYGLAESGTQGSYAIEAELRRLQNSVLERYSVRVLMRVLSIGVFDGNI
jgi:hypothetical protein